MALVALAFETDVKSQAVAVAADDVEPARAAGTSLERERIRFDFFAPHFARDIYAACAAPGNHSLVLATPERAEDAVLSPETRLEASEELPTSRSFPTGARARQTPGFHQSSMSGEESARPSIVSPESSARFGGDESRAFPTSLNARSFRGDAG